MELIQTKKGRQGIDHQNTLSSTVKLGSIYMQKMVTTLPDRIRDNVQLKEEDVVPLTRSPGKIMNLLEYLKRDNVPITENVAEEVVENETKGA